jgi:transpeptidase family protein/MecA-like transpeptidase family protein
MRTAARMVVGGVVAAMLGVAGYGGFNIYEALAVDADGTPAAKPTGPPSADEVRGTAHDFLTAWEQGHTTKAAALTDYRSEADDALSAFHDDLHLAALRLKAGTPTGRTVPFHAQADLSLDGRTYHWSYDSSLHVVRGRTTGRPLVDWKPSVLYPKLTDGESLHAGEAGTPEVKIVGRNGTTLSATDYPSLKAVLPTLRTRYGAKAGGTSGLELWSEKSDGSTVETLKTFRHGKAGVVRTTLDARVQKAAEAAVLRFPESSVVAVQPSTGDILGFANHRKDGFNAAFDAELAPGSTMKVITSALLIEKGVVSAKKPAVCPKYAQWGGRSFHNEGGFSIEGGTFADSFARSCNTAFIKHVDDIKEDDMQREAQDVFGLGLGNWKIGVPNFDGKVPPATGPEQAAEMIGQGKVQLNPLTMASVAATAKAGAFHQPVLVPADVDHRPIAHARRPLPAAVSAQLRDLMRRTVRNGTATGVFHGLSGDLGAKTGSAEVGDQATSDSWFVGFRNDMAAAALVQAGGAGHDAAGPVVRDVLAAGH